MVSRLAAARRRHLATARPGARAALALAFAAAIAPADVPAAYKCWTNKDGIRECGESVPPEYAQQGHETMSDQGLRRDRTEPAPDKSELDRLRAEQAAREAEEKRLAEQRRRDSEADRVLMNTYTKEQELLKNRDARLSSLDSRVEHSRQVMIRLDEARHQIEEEAAEHERGGEALPDALVQRLASNLKQIRESQASIAVMLAEKGELEDRFTWDLKRFRELKGIAPADGGPSTE